MVTRVWKLRSTVYENPIGRCVMNTTIRLAGMGVIIGFIVFWYADMHIAHKPRVTAHKSNQESIAYDATFAGRLRTQ